MKKQLQIFKYLEEHPEATDEEVVAAIGCSKTYVYVSRKYLNTEGTPRKGRGTYLSNKKELIRKLRDLSLGQVCLETEQSTTTLQQWMKYHGIEE